MKSQQAHEEVPDTKSLGKCKAQPQRQRSHSGGGLRSEKMRDWEDGEELEPFCTAGGIVTRPLLWEQHGGS